MNEVASDPGVSLQELKEELFRIKSRLVDILRGFPDDLKAHRVYCAYVGKTLDLHKVLLKARMMDPEKILADALMSVVLTLNEKGEAQAAEAVARYLEPIEEKVKEKWQDFRETVSPGKTNASALPQSPVLPPSPEPRDPTGTGGGSGP